MSIEYEWSSPTDSVFMYITPGFISTGNFVAFDMDWTLSRTYRGIWPKSPQDITLLPNRLNKLKELQDKGYNIVIFTNQKSTTENKRIFNKERINNLIKMLPNIPLIVLVSLKDDIYRKPNIGMYNILQRLIPKIKSSYYVGDAAGRPQDFSDSDILFAKKTQMKFYTPEEMFSSIERIKPRPNLKVDTINFPEHKNMVLFVGMPGSHKTTYYNNNLSNYIHINQDTLKTKSKVMKKTKETMKNGLDLVIDATNSGQNKRESFYTLAQEYDYNITVLYFVKDGRGWNKLRKSPVPPVAYGVYYKYLIEPTPENTPGRLYQIG